MICSKCGKECSAIVNKTPAVGPTVLMNNKVVSDCCGADIINGVGPDKDWPKPENKIDDGGPAFPCEVEEFFEKQDRYLATGLKYTVHNKIEVVKKPGMTLRDYFAAKAMQGMLAEGTLCSIEGNATNSLEALCLIAYDYADAMLKARNAKSTQNKSG